MDCFNNLLAQRAMLWNRTRNGEGANRLEDHEATVVQYQIKNFQTLFEAEHMDDCAGACEQVLQIMGASKIGLDVSGARAHIDGLIARFQFEFRKHAFLRVDKELASFVDTHILLGRDVAVSFPSACADIKEAGNCLAADCNTAAVFHLMRIAEYGLRALARDRKSKSLPAEKDTPLELRNWEDIIKELEASEKAIGNYPKTSARELQFAFYHGALTSLRAFKNHVRNPVMHTRESFDHYRAMSVRNHVKEFMERLATMLSEETESGPEQWTDEWINTRTSERKKALGVP
jgi:hypothetical protein